MTLRLILLAGIAGLTACAGWNDGPSPLEPDEDRYRVVIMTDMTHDDGNSLIRYLYYAPHFDTEAIIVTPQLPDFNHDAGGPWEKVQGILDAYRQERDQLVRHDARFPTYEQLSAITHRGRGALPIIWLTEERKFAAEIAGRYVESSWGEIRFSDWIGDGQTPHGEPKDSDGSEFLQQVFDRDDDRPIFVQMWGGPITFMQALYRYEERRGSEKLRELLDKVHIYAIHLQDITFDYIVDLDDVRNTDCAHMGETRSTYDGPRVTPRRFLLDFGHFWKYITAVHQSQVNGHGPMSDIYDHGGEGDTPAFLYLVSGILGLNDPLDPTHGSWGNMFYPMGEPFPGSYFHTCPGDRQELERWIPDATNSFMARLQWSTREPGEVNRAPVAVLNGDESNRILRLAVAPGETVELDASLSHDPDGDTLRFTWSHYGAASTYPGPVELDRPDEAVQTVAVPEDVGDGTIHLVLEVRDGGSPELVAYRRVILTGSGG
jgi:hypothetical protein